MHSTLIDPQSLIKLEIQRSVQLSILSIFAFTYIEELISPELVSSIPTRCSTHTHEKRHAHWDTIIVSHTIKRRVSCCNGLSSGIILTSRDPESLDVALLGSRKYFHIRKLHSWDRPTNSANLESGRGLALDFLQLMQELVTIENLTTTLKRLVATSRIRMRHSGDLAEKC